MALAISAYSQDQLEDWGFTSSMIVKRQQVAVVTSGDYIYAFGGTGKWATDPYSTVERARINSDGTLGKWILETDTLPIPVYGAEAIAVDDYIYVIAGNQHPYAPTTAVQRAEVNPDGSLQSWQQMSTLNNQRVNPAVCEYQDYIYVMGGNPSKALNSVEYAQINPDGSLSSWQYTSASQVGRWLPTAQAYNGYVYLIGGFNGGPNSTVEYAAINPDGSLSEWSYTSSLTVPRSGSPGSALLNGYLYALVGDNNSDGCLNTVEKAYINSDGTLGTWVLESDTLVDRITIAGCAQKGIHVYLVGGGDAVDSTLDDVQVNGFDSSDRVCGDADCTYTVDIDDVVYLIQYIFQGGIAPCDPSGDGVPDC